MLMINPDIDLFLSFFPWKDCRIYHNLDHLEEGKETDDDSHAWKDIILSSMPTDCEFLIRATYTDAVTIVSEYLLLSSDRNIYVPSISVGYLKSVLAKTEEKRATCSYPLLLAQVFQAYFNFFRHEEMYLQFLRCRNLDDANLEVLTRQFECVVCELQKYLEKLEIDSQVNEKDFLSKLINGTLSSLEVPLTPLSDDSDDYSFRLKVKNKRNNQWSSNSRYANNKKSKYNEGEDGLFYHMPSGKLPLLSQAVSMVLSEEFLFDQSYCTSKTQPKPAKQSFLDDLPEQGNVHRRQKIKRKRFRLVFHEDSLSLPDIESTSSRIIASEPKPDFDPNDFDENDPLVRKSGYLALKGVVAITNNRFRVQLNAFKHEKKKFSRNTSDLNEALWIFEICLLISDSPACLSQQMRIGNYHSLVLLPSEFKYFRNPVEYFVELGRQILLFSCRDDVFSRGLLQIAIANFENLTLNVSVHEEVYKSMTSSTLSSSERSKEGQFWHGIVKAFKSENTIKACDLEFRSLFTNCPPSPIFPKIYMSKEQ